MENGKKSDISWILLALGTLFCAGGMALAPFPIIALLLPLPVLVGMVLWALAFRLNAVLGVAIALSLLYPLYVAGSVSIVTGDACLAAQRDARYPGKAFNNPRPDIELETLRLAPRVLGAGILMAVLIFLTGKGAIAALAAGVSGLLIPILSTGLVYTLSHFWPLTA